MNKKKVTELFEKLLENGCGVRTVKFDLHIHTPESKDFYKPKGMDENALHLSILQEIIDNDIEIVAVTDHNTFNGFNKLKNLIKSSRELKRKYKGLLLLCGIEITCYSNHLLAIFDSNFDLERQGNFLHDIGIDRDSQGTENAMADELGISALFEKIYYYGGIAILAHADSEKGFLYTYCRQSGQQEVAFSFTGKSLAKIVKSPYLYGIQVCSDYGKNRISQLISNSDYKRIDRDLPFLFFSDSHGILINGAYSGKSGKNIGSVFSMAKLSFKSFSALKMALTDVNARIIYQDSEPKHPYIIGCAIKSEILKEEKSEFSFFRFNPNMNCIIGSRGTGKSTLLGIIQEVIRYETYGLGNLEYTDRYETAVVFIKDGDRTFAVSNDVNSNKYRSIFVKPSQAHTFASYSGSKGFLALFLTKMYAQRELYDYKIYPDKLLEIVDDFIMWKRNDEYGKYVRQINQNIEDAWALFDKCNKRNLEIVSYIVDEGIKKQYLEKYQNVFNAKKRYIRDA